MGPLAKGRDLVCLVFQHAWRLQQVSLCHMLLHRLAKFWLASNIQSTTARENVGWITCVEMNHDTT
jgi:hypothetical protein